MSNNSNLIILNTNTKLFLNCLDELTEEQAMVRVTENLNSIKWIAAHTIWTRFHILGLMGFPPENHPYIPLFANYRPMEATDDFGTLDEIRQEWQRATNHLENNFPNIDNASWENDSPIFLPIQLGKSNLHMISALVQHESFHVGQMSILKKIVSGKIMNLINI